MDELESSSDVSTEPNEVSNAALVRRPEDDLDDPPEVSVVDKESVFEDASATAEWSHFMSSAKGVQQYMEGAAVAIVDASALVAPLHQQQQQGHGGIDMTVKVENQHALAKPSGADLCSGIEAASVCLRISPAGAPFTPPRGDPTMEDALKPVVLSPSSPRDSYPEKRERTNAQSKSLPEEFEHRVSTEVGGRSARRAVALLLCTTGDHASAAKNGYNDYKDAERVAETGDGSAITTADPSLPQVVSPCRAHTREGGTGNRAGQTSSSVVSDEMDVNSRSVDDVCSSRSSTSKTLVLGSPSSEPPPRVFGDGVAAGRAKMLTSTPEPPWVSRSLEVNGCLACMKDTAMSHILGEGCVCLRKRQAITTDDRFQAKALVSVGEEEVVRRIAQDKVRALEARRQQRTDNLER